MSLLIGIKNTTSQTVPALGAINIGSVYRRYCKKNQCGFRTFEADATSAEFTYTLKNVEGTPSISVKVLGEDEKAKRYDLTEYFGGGATDLTYIGVECDAATRQALGLSDDAASLEIKYGKLSIKPTKVGSGKITVKALAGYDEDGVADGNTQIGGMEISRTISIVSRGVAAGNGGWL